MQPSPSSSPTTPRRQRRSPSLPPRPAVAYPLHRAFPSTRVSNPRSSSSLREAATASRGSPPPWPRPSCARAAPATPDARARASPPSPAVLTTATPAEHRRSPRPYSPARARPSWPRPATTLRPASVVPSPPSAGPCSGNGLVMATDLPCTGALPGPPVLGVRPLGRVRRPRPLSVPVGPTC